MNRRSNQQPVIADLLRASWTVTPGALKSQTPQRTAQLVQGSDPSATRVVTFIEEPGSKGPDSPMIVDWSRLR